ncbi:hypothetical protein N478_05495 [Pseudoalteromonas luteoviolacea S4060-1]|uniref:Uncharacterized protein n=1 Tax=Pseudoalteromonas luteoviolacea S4060-1 TaxID=1365257 RepID=A0A162ALK6_9GAMM|nr:hypothetical protein N478_05495 [Pseudoalteromonas luteoviolacea S4060-1]
MKLKKKSLIALSPTLLDRVAGGTGGGGGGVIPTQQAKAL